MRIGPKMRCMIANADRRVPTDRAVHSVAQYMYMCMHEAEDERCACRRKMRRVHTMPCVTLLPSVKVKGRCMSGIMM